MADVCVYYFSIEDAAPGESCISARRATLEAIKGWGRAIMRTQIVVDHTELDDDGFLIPCAGGAAAENDLMTHIRSMKLRAASRIREAQKLNDTTEGKDKYLLGMESRELRNQAKKLENLRADVMTDDSQNFVNFGRLPTAE